MDPLGKALKIAIPVLAATGLLMWVRAAASEDTYQFVVWGIIAATAILIVIRWVNRRDDPRQTNLPPEED